MFIVLYEMKAKEGKEAQFEKAWAEVTECIYETKGSLGSRLHSTPESGVYIAYAQWPSEEAFTASRKEPLTNAEDSVQCMLDAIESSTILRQMEVLDDRTRIQPQT